MTFKQMWASSSWNDYTWVLPAVLIAGMAILVLFNSIQRAFLRRIMKIICALVFMVVAVQASFMGINEKWRIRHEWWRQHNDSLTERERSALVADGANLTLGPLILGGGRALLLFSITALVLHFVVKRKTH